MSVAISVLDPMQTAKAVEAIGVSKAHLSYPRMAVLSVLAGAYIGMGAQLYLLVTSNEDGSAASGPQKLLGGFAFSVGLVMIAMAGAELFTGNCLLLIAWLTGKIKLAEVLLDWMVVWIFNFVGSIAVAGLIYGTGINGYYHEDYTAMGKNLCKVAAAKANEKEHEMFVRGIAANALVCLAVILAIASKSPSGKILGIAMPIATFVALGFDHCIANMTFFSLAVMVDCPLEDEGRYWLNLLLSTCGNTLGASVLAFSYYFSYMRDNVEVQRVLSNHSLDKKKDAVDPQEDGSQKAGDPLREASAKLSV
mmetsp:Transcript_15582/g.36482  ORF Transcript_15582/g.36482 Transcript_15582/m.36482 type:complete len:308 (+) Transcript_15582:92-1015(+)|eukprot:CAMPEP_0178404694 /NCGR_PEP_ID=MMETSP0689_2-20121128/18018_1 /TAXON_ID=160604 /ORGANISM="Amphidinium massartii, Strain CS-259" /LENGTH=307 /DNA_ID=CAMNT_0020025691 /DNA_START=87 /DNA_END=1010 /DNA_ORIENTATION=+